VRWVAQAQVCVVWRRKLIIMSGRRRGEQHCHMQIRARDKSVVGCCTKDVSRCSRAIVRVVGRRPSAACEEGSPTMPIYRPVFCDPERAKHQSVALACEWACGCPLRWRILHYFLTTTHLPSLHTLPSIGAGLTYSDIATRDGPMAPGPMAAAPPQSSCNRFKPRNSFRFILPF
jgi:hypothetical protein